MKTLVVTFLLLFATASTDFCDGWKEGYKEGWCFDVNFGCMPPPPPLCPLPDVGRDTYKDGYNRGFLQGKKDKENGN